MRFIMVIIVCLIVCCFCKADEHSLVSCHGIEFPAPDGYQRISAEELRTISYTNRYGDICGYNIGFSKTDNLDVSHPHILIRFLPEKRNYMPACKKSILDFSQIGTQPEDEVVYDQEKGVLFLRAVRNRENNPLSVLIAAPAEGGFVCIYFFFNEASESEAGLLMNSLVAGLNLNDNEVYFSFFYDNRVKIISLVGFFISGVFSVYLFKRAYWRKKIGR